MQSVKKKIVMSVRGIDGKRENEQVRGSANALRGCMRTLVPSFARSGHSLSSHEGKRISETMKRRAVLWLGQHALPPRPDQSNRSGCLCDLSGQSLGPALSEIYKKTHRQTVTDRQTNF
jgi:hypothetical protein